MLAGYVYITREATKGLSESGNNMKYNVIAQDETTENQTAERRTIAEGYELKEAADLMKRLRSLGYETVYSIEDETGHVVPSSIYNRANKGSKMVYGIYVEGVGEWKYTDSSPVRVEGSKYKAVVLAKSATDAHSRVELNKPAHVFSVVTGKIVASVPANTRFSDNGEVFPPTYGNVSELPGFPNK